MIPSCGFSSDLEAVFFGCGPQSLTQNPIFCVVCLAVLRVMSWTQAQKGHAVALVVSKSLVRRRLRFSQASVRSPPHLRGRSSKPFAVSDRLMISIVQSPVAASAPLSFSQVSVRIWRFLPLTFLPAS